MKLLTTIVIALIVVPAVCWLEWRERRRSAHYLGLDAWRD